MRSRAIARTVRPAGRFGMCVMWPLRRGAAGWKLLTRGGRIVLLHTLKSLPPPPPASPRWWGFWLSGLPARGVEPRLRHGEILRGRGQRFAVQADALHLPGFQRARRDGEE